MNMPIQDQQGWTFFRLAYEGGRITGAAPEKHSKQIAAFDSRARITLRTEPNRAAVLSALRSRSDGGTRRARLLARRRMLAFSGNRADVVQWQNISFPS